MTFTNKGTLQAIHDFLTFVLQYTSREPPLKRKRTCSTAKTPMHKPRTVFCRYQPAHSLVQAGHKGANGPFPSRGVVIAVDANNHQML